MKWIICLFKGGHQWGEEHWTGFAEYVQVCQRCGTSRH